MSLELGVSSCWWEPRYCPLVKAVLIWRKFV